MKVPFESILEWAENEQPVERPEDDRFGRSALARRVARRLKSEFSRDQTFALVGEFGSGKSTIVHFVEEYLARDKSLPHVWLCNVSCWGFENSTAALQNVLSTTLRTLEDYVDCLSVRGLPEEYLRVLAKGSGGWRASVLQTASPTRPEDQLRRLSKILQALKARLVLSIEDVDRNTSSDFDPQHIQRMLYSLKSVNGVTFILSANSQGPEIDITKLCEHIESVPRLDSAQVGADLRRLRKHGLELYEDVAVVAEGGLIRNELGFPENSEEARIARSMGLPTYGLVGALALLIKTPRALKHLIRRVISVWDRLHGEIDFDDLLLAISLRLRAPECFDFLIRNMDRLRASGRQRGDTVGRSLSDLDKKDELAEEFEASVARCEEPDATRVVLSHLGLRDFRFPTTEVPRQGILRSDPTDYWRRLLAEELAPTELCDQEVVRDIVLWLKQRRRSLVEHLTSSEENSEQYARVWEHFSDRIDNGELLNLAGEVTRQLLEKHKAAAWPEQGLLAIWRRANRRIEKSADSARWLSELLGYTVPRSLTMTNHLYYYWASVRSGIVEQSGREEVRRAMIATAKASYDRGEALVAALSDDEPQAVDHLVRPVDGGTEPSSILSDADDWHWLVPVLLDAMTTERVLRAQLILLVLDRQGSISRKYDLDIDFAGRLFRERLREAMKLMASAESRGAEADGLAAIIDQGRDQAQAYLIANPQG